MRLPDTSHGHYTADVLLGKFKKDISFALRRGTIAQVTSHHHLALDGCAWLRLATPGQRAAEDEIDRLDLSNILADMTAALDGCAWLRLATPGQRAAEDRRRGSQGFA
jgi:hypothetical protein